MSIYHVISFKIVIVLAYIYNKMRIEYQKLMIENGTYNTNISCTICLVDILYLPYGLIKTSAALSQPIKNTNSKVRNNGMQSKNPPICLYPEM